MSTLLTGNVRLYKELLEELRQARAVEASPDAIALVTTRLEELKSRLTLFERAIVSIDWGLK